VTERNVKVSLIGKAHSKEQEAKAAAGRGFAADGSWCDDDASRQKRITLIWLLQT
jgi:hypothetical protein